MHGLHEVVVVVVVVVIVGLCERRGPLDTAAQQRLLCALRRLLLVRLLELSE